MALVIQDSISEDLRKSVQRLLPKQATEVLFYVACCLWLSFRVINTSFLVNLLPLPWLFSESNMLYYTTMLVVLCELGYIMRVGYSTRDAYALALFIVMSIGPITRDFTPLIGDVLLIFCARNYSPKRVVAMSSAIVCVTCLVVLVAAGTGVIWDRVLGSNSFPGGADRMRHYLGFFYALYPSQFAFCLTCTVCYVRGQRLSVVEGLLLLAMNVLMYLLTQSRLSFALACLLVALVLVTRMEFFRSRSWPRLGKLLAWAFPLALIISVGITLLYGVLHAASNDVLEGLNKYFAGRLSLGYNGLHEYGFTMLGQNVPWQGNGLNSLGYNIHSQEYNYVDNLFLHMLLEQGLLYTAGFIVLTTCLSIQAWREGDYVLLLVLAATAAHYMVDDLAMYLHYDLILFLIAGLQWKNLTASGLHDSAEVSHA